VMLKCESVMLLRELDLQHGVMLKCELVMLKRESVMP